jgi:NTE family protein
LTKIHKRKIGLVLGGGSARGWSHIGVIRALQEAGVEPDIVCGTSIGSLVGAAYAAGELDRLEAWVKSLTWQNVVSLLDVTVTGGFIKGAKLVEFFASRFTDVDITKLPKPFGAVATELLTGREVWLREGSVIESVRASIAVPGLFTPVLRDGRLLVDGALVNPVPVSLCRAMGADIVIAVDLNTDMVGRYLRKPAEAKDIKPPRRAGRVAFIFDRLQAGLAIIRSGPKSSNAMPSVLDVLATSINIMQIHIARSRLAGEPADVLITPRLSQMALLDFHRAAAAISEGSRATNAVLSQLTHFLEEK